MRGRVIARDGDRLRVRTAAGDVEVVGEAAPGDLVEGEPPRVVQPGPGGDYPGPASEVARLDRPRLALLQARGRALAALRGFFAERGFLEVDTPLLVPSPGLEIHLRAVAAGTGWLITSPEYQMKRLLAAGLERIYTVCKCFRADEEGAHHSSEFTMLEWYRAWAGLDDILRDTEELVATVVQAVSGGTRTVVAGRVIDVAPPWPRLTVAEALARHAGVDLRGAGEAGELAARVRAAGIEVGAAAAWDDVFYCAFLDRVEPALAAAGRPVFLTDWPVQLAALARRSPADPTVVERFEAYAGGLELANAFGELTDAAEQRARFAEDQAARRARGLPVYPVDERLLAALAEGLPPCAGIALGVDRLVMLAGGAAAIREVLTFAGDEL